MSITSITSDNISRDSIVNAQKPVPPTITGYAISASDDTALDPAGGQTVLINGSGFQRGATVNVAGVAIAAVSYISSNQLSFTTTARAAGTYAIYVVNADLGTAIFVPGLVYSNLPTWTTGAGSLGSYFETRPISNTVAASGDAPLSYSLVSGSLPPGATLSSTGIISGNSPVESGSTTYSFTIEAVDAQNQSSTRSFSLTINTDVVTWSNPPSGATIAIDGTAYTSALSATSAAGYSVSYAANSLPAGLTLSGGTISGTPTTAGTTSTTLTATAATTNRSATNTITWVVNLGDTFFNLTTLLLSGSANTFIRDASTNNFPITVFGDTRPNTFNPYLTGWSNFFDGSGDFLTLPTNAALGPTSGDYTWEAWLYPTVLGSNKMIYVSSQNSGSLGIGIGQSTANRLTVFRNGVAFDFIGTTDMSVYLNRWVHVAVTKQSGTTRFWIDGVNTDTFTTNHTYVAGGSAASIGRRVSVSEDYTGNISNMRLVNGTAVYTANFTPPTQPLTAIAGTSLLTCQSNRLIDASTNNFTITRNGDVTVDSFSPFVEPATTNGSGFFDGTGDYLTVSTSSFFPAVNTYTIEMWAYPTSWPGSNGIALYHVSNSLIDFFGTLMLVLTGSGTIRLDVRPSNGGTNVSITATSTIALNSWNHIAVSVNSGSVTIYINGIASGTGTVQVLNGTQTHCAIGYLTNGFTSGQSSFAGYISNVRVIRNTALYTANFTPPTSPLTAVANTSLLTLQTNRSHTNNQLLDSSSENHFVTRAGNVTHGSFSPYSPSGWSNSFTGSGDFLTLPSSSSAYNFGSGVNFTVEAWVYPTLLAGASWGIIDARVSAATSAAWIVHLVPSSGTYRLEFFNAGTNTGTAVIPLNTWTHVAVVRNGTALRTYVNGVLDLNLPSYGSGSISPGTTSPRVGPTKDASGTTYTTVGNISNLRIVNGTALYTSNFTPNTQPLTTIPGTVLLTCADNRFLDDSVNRFAITRSGDVRITNFSPFRAQTQVPTTYSAFFDGNGDTLTTPSSTAFNISGNFTIEGWYNFTALPPANQNDNLWTFSGATTFNPYLYLWGDGTLVLRTTQTGGTVFSVTHNFALGVWYHIAVVKSGTTFTLYINGTSTATGTSSAIVSENKSLIVGESSTFGLQGYLSNFRVVNGQALYTSNFTPSTTPLTTTSQGATASNVSLLTCQSATFVDNSPNNFTLTIAGNSQPSMVNPFGSTFTSSTGYSVANHGGSVYFDGSGDNVTLASSPAFALPGDFTFETWMYPTAFQGTSSGTIFNIGQFSNGLFIRVSSTVIDVIAVNTQLLNPTRSTSIPTLNCWYHLAVVKRGSTYTLYVDGVNIGTATNSTAIAAGAVTIGVSAHNGTELYQGYLGDTRLVKGTALYTSNFAPPVAPLQAVPGTVLLLNGTGPAITDASTKNLVETVGDVRVTSAVSRTGGSSMFFDGTGDRLIVPSSPNFDFPGNFTIEMWINFANVTSTWQSIISRAYGVAGGWRLYKNDGNNQLRWYSNLTSVVLTTGSTLANNTWSHIAVVRNAGTVTIYIDGISRGSASNSTSYTPGNYALEIGEGVVTSAFPITGYIQDLRITNGTARYTANFTPPAGAFPVT